MVSSQFIDYFAIATTAWLIAFVVVAPRRTFDLSRCVGWYLLVFYLTYMLRPLGSEIMGDNTMYVILDIDHMEQHWKMLALAISLAILFFAVGYRLAVSRPSRTPRGRRVDDFHIVGADNVFKAAVLLMVWGYATLLLAYLTGHAGGEIADVQGATMGVYEHNTAYLMQSDLFVSTGAVLYYILTGRLGMSLLFTLPWFGAKLLYGWGRSNILGYFFAVMSVYFLKARLTKSRMSSVQVLLISFGVIVILCLFPFLGMMRSLKANLHMSAFSSGAVSIIASQTDPIDMMQTYLGTNSSIQGFEPTLYHLLVNKRPEWGTKYLYYYVFEPIPRVIFPDKGTQYSWPKLLLGIDMDPRIALTGTAPGSVGGAFEQWGWIGIPCEFLFTGWLLGWAEERVRRKPNAAYVQLGYAGFYSMLPMLGRSPLLNMIALKWMFPYGVTVFILWRVHKHALRQERIANRKLTMGRVAMAAGPSEAGA